MSWQRYASHGALQVCEDSRGSLLQLAGFAPIFSPKSARLFIVSLLKGVGTGGSESP
jgi:hypothetical protein